MSSKVKSFSIYDPKTGKVESEVLDTTGMTKQDIAKYFKAKYGNDVEVEEV
jgi:predicted transcriptional regulator